MSFPQLTSIFFIAALLSLSAQANGTNTEETNDSVTSWGPWALPISTAAGPEVQTNPLVLAAEGAREFVFFDPELDQPEIEEGCIAATVCGYASFYSFFRVYEDQEESQVQEFDELVDEGPYVKKRRRGRQDFSLIPVSARFSVNEQPFGEGLEEGGLSFLVIPEGDGLYPEIESLLLEQNNFLFAFNHAGEDSRFDAMSFFTLAYDEDSSEDLLHGYWLSIRTDEELFEPEGDAKRTRPKPLKQFFRYLNRHVGGTDSISLYMGSYVIGNTSGLSDINNMISALTEFNEGGDLIANYHGFTALGADVHLNVNFSNSSWGGSVNYGVDGPIAVYQSENGTSVLGHVGFEVVGGTIDGINLNASSEQLSALDGTVEGSVSASFFGADAKKIGGVADIVKTKMPQGEIERSLPKRLSYENGAHVTTFSATYSEEGQYVRDL